MKKNCLTFFLIGAGFVAAVTALYFGLAVLSNHTMANLQKLQRAYTPPVVMIDSPEMGSSAPVGSAVLVNATILNRLEARRVELWMDGILVSQFVPEAGKAQPPIHVTFDLIVPSEGIHTILVRAINTDGVIGSSVPFQIMGSPKSAHNQGIIKVNQPQDIQQIADTYHLTRQEIEQANPGLPAVVPPGTSLTVPLPPAIPSGSSGGSPQPTTTPAGIKKPMGNPTPTKQPSQPTATWPALKTVESVLIPFHIFPGNDKIPPAAPTDLQAKVENCTITLNWMDNADNEKFYTVKYINPSAQVIKLTTLESSSSKGRAWYEFPAPTYGRLTLWVEATNDIGTASSNIVPLDVEPKCNMIKPQLEIEAVKYEETDTAIVNFYCYVTIGNGWAFRVPEAENTFIYFKDGPAGIATYLAGNNKLIIPLPDGSLDIQVECMGWRKPGNNLLDLVTLGTGSQSFLEDTWDGNDRILTLHENSAPTVTGQITLHIRPFQPYGSPPSIYGFDNPLLPAPYALTQKQVGDPVSYDDPYAQYEWYWNRLIQWKWDGDRSKINGFRIYLNGKPVEDDPRPTDTGFLVTLPDTCGLHVRWQVAAYGPNFQSPLSAPVEEDLPGCEKKITADISIPSVILGATRDSGSKFMEENTCDTLETYLKLYVDGQVRNFLGGGFYMALTCNQRYDLNIFSDDWLQQKYASLGGPTHFQTSFYVPVQKGNTLGNDIKFVVGGELWGWNDNGDDGLVTEFKEEFRVASYDELKLKYPGNKCQDTDLGGYELANDTSWTWCVKFLDAP